MEALTALGSSQTWTPRNSRACQLSVSEYVEARGVFTSSALSCSTSSIFAWRTWFYIALSWISGFGCNSRRHHLPEHVFQTTRPRQREHHHDQKTALLQGQVRQRNRALLCHSPSACSPTATSAKVGNSY